MKENTTNWTNEEFKAYLLLYCANTDYVVTSEEQEMIEDKIGESTLKKIRKEFEEDHDFQRVQKIINTAKNLDLAKEQVDKLIEEMDNLFKADGKFDSLEKNCFRELKRLLG